MTSANMARLERDTPIVEELGRRAGEQITADPRQRAYVEDLVREMIERLRKEREGPRS